MSSTTRFVQVTLKNTRRENRWVNLNNVLYLRNLKEGCEITFTDQRYLTVDETSEDLLLLGGA